MIKLEMKKFNMILIEKLQEHLPYNQAKLISMNFIQRNKHYLLIKNK